LGETAYAQTIRGENGSSAGSIDANSAIRDDIGSAIGKIESDGTVHNDIGSAIGRGETIQPQWLAAYWFFFFNQ
jgi:hypothetical protein